MTDRKIEVGRLALRVEGEFWNAYYALPGTMDGALLLSGRYGCRSWSRTRF